MESGLSDCCKSLCKWKRRNALLADLAEALLQGGWDFSIQDLQNRLDVFPGGVSAQIAGEETKEVCGRTDRQTDRRSALVTEMQVSVVEDAGRRKQGLQHQWWMRCPQHGNRAAEGRSQDQSPVFIRKTLTLSSNMKKVFPNRKFSSVFVARLFFVDVCRYI